MNRWWDGCLRSVVARQNAKAAGRRKGDGRLILSCGHEVKWPNGLNRLDGGVICMTCVHLKETA